MLEEQLGKSVTGDPPVIESLLENYRDVVCPDNASVIHRFHLIPEFSYRGSSSRLLAYN